MLTRSAIALQAFPTRRYVIDKLNKQQFFMEEKPALEIEKVSLEILIEQFKSMSGVKREIFWCKRRVVV